jgi:tRNA nucleotidyltransferase/poly(A) polymerase
MLNRLKSVFKYFQQHEVRYVVIGGIAAVLYGVPRATFDLDILIEATPENAQRLLDALIDAGMITATLTNVDGILANEITIFQDRVRIDVQISTPGLQFETAWERKQIMKYQGQAFYVVSLDDLISSKRAAGRDVDLEDVRLLELPDNQGTT